MATQFKNKVVKEVGTVPILAIETDAATRSTIVGLSLANLTESVVSASVLVHDDTSVINRVFVSYPSSTITFQYDLNIGWRAIQ